MCRVMYADSENAYFYVHVMNSFHNMAQNMDPPLSIVVMAQKVGAYKVKMVQK